jgi:hypothetical protein
VCRMRAEATLSTVAVQVRVRWRAVYNFVGSMRRHLFPATVRLDAVDVGGALAGNAWIHDGDGPVDERQGLGPHGLDTAEKYRNTGRKSVDADGLRRTNDKCSEGSFQTLIRCDLYFASRGSQAVQRLYGVCANAAHSSRLRSRGAVCGTVPLCRRSHVCRQVSRVAVCGLKGIKAAPAAPQTDPGTDHRPQINEAE